MGPGTANEDEDEFLDLPMVERSLEGVVDTNIVNEIIPNAKPSNLPGQSNPSNASNANLVA